MARVSEESHCFTCHPHVYPQVEWTMPAVTPQPQSIAALWLVLISHPTEGRRLSWSVCNQFYHATYMRCIYIARYVLWPGLSVSSRNGWMNQAGFQHRGYPWLTLHCVGREFRYLPNSELSSFLLFRYGSSAVQFSLTIPSFTLGAYLCLRQLP